MATYLCDKILDGLCTGAFGLLWTERLLYDYRDFLRSFFVNRMVAVRPSLSKYTDTLTVKTFGTSE